MERKEFGRSREVLTATKAGRMKAQELRLGNIIKQGVIDLLEVRMVEGVAEINCVRCNGSSVGEPLPEPITEEWLVKFGFEKREVAHDYQSVCYIKNNIFGFFFPNGGAFEYNLGKRNAKYTTVHQLQNLYFSLTGEELPITETK